MIIGLKLDEMVDDILSQGRHVMKQHCGSRRCCVVERSKLHVSERSTAPHIVSTSQPPADRTILVILSQHIRSIFDRFGRTGLPIVETRVEIRCFDGSMAIPIHWWLGCGRLVYSFRWLELAFL